MKFVNPLGRSLRHLCTGALFVASMALSTVGHAQDAASPTTAALVDQIRQLKEMIQRQQVQIDELRAAVQGGTQANKVQSGDPEVSAAASTAVPPVTQAAVSTAPAAVSDANIAKSLASLSRSLGGIRFSGDMRLRFDLQDRTGNGTAAPLQNARERYRLRLNVDRDFFFAKEPDRSLFRVHAQLATAPLNNPLTMDTDFTGVDTRASISLSEAWVDFTPSRKVALRLGRTPELFADNLQYVFDDDVRFNGFQESFRAISHKSLFFDVKAGQYILTNPHVLIVPAGSPYLNAGYRLGQRVPSADLFDQGVTVGGNISSKWRHSLTGNYLVVREANQIQLASTTAGFPLFTSPELGATLTGPLPQTGNATTTPGGAIYNADGFHLLRGAYQLNYAGRQVAGHNFPVRFFVQGTLNLRASTERTGFTAGATLGQATRLGDVLLQYQYLYKPANGMVSQLTDDDVGTGTGVNLRTHAFRLDFGLTRYATWENRIYIQNPITHSNPATNFYVPYERGANTTIRLQSQFQFTF